jgi:hypothetical protein
MDVTLNYIIHHKDRPDLEFYTVSMNSFESEPHSFDIDEMHDYKNYLKKQNPAYLMNLTLKPVKIVYYKKQPSLHTQNLLMFDQ